MTAPCLFCGQLQPDHPASRCPNRPPLPRDPLQPARPIPAPQVPANPRPGDGPSRGMRVLDEVARRVWEDGPSRLARGRVLNPWDDLPEDVRESVRASIGSTVAHTLDVAAELMEQGRLRRD